MALTWIYLMRDNDTGFFKIGRSIDPRSRLKTLQKQDTLQPKPNDYQLIEAWWADERVEKYLHDYFYQHRRRGEWFELGSDQLADIRKHFDTYQPFSIAHRPGSLEQLLRNAREEISKLRYDLQSADSKLKNYMDMVQRRDIAREKEESTKKGVEEYVSGGSQPRPNVLRLLEDTRLAPRRKA